MNCNDYLPLICGYLDGENTESENKNLQAHLVSCVLCRDILAQMQENDRLLAEVPQAPMDLTCRIMQQVRKEPKKHNHWKRWSAALSAAAVLAVVLLSGTFFPTMEKSREAVLDTESGAMQRSATEALAPADAMTEAWTFADAEMSTALCFAAYLCTTPVAELESLERMDLSAARTLLTADAAAKLDVLASGELSAYWISADLMQDLQTSYAFELLGGDTEADNYIIFLSNTNTP